MPERETVRLVRTKLGMSVVDFTPAAPSGGGFSAYADCRVSVLTQITECRAVLGLPAPGPTIDYPSLLADLRARVGL